MKAFFVQRWFLLALAIILYLGISQADNRSVLAMRAAVLGLHLGILVMGMGSLVGFSRGDRIAVGIAGSQKTLMVGLQVGIELEMSILPIVVFHIGQLLLDTIIADQLRKGDPGESSIASP